MEGDCEYISSRGFVYSSDHHDPEPKSEVHWCRGINFGAIRRGDILHVTSAAAWHVFQCIDQIPEPFVLVTGDSDTSIPNSTFWPNDEAFFRAIEHPKLLHWFAQNLLRSHPKLTHLPIALDYHSVRNGFCFGVPQALPIEQERVLKEIASGAKPFWERNRVVYFNLFHERGDDRRTAMKTVDPSICFKEQAEIPRTESWKHQAECTFVLAPFGNGPDTHRAWEALILGCIPIIHTSGLDPVYEGLPVWLVNDWNEVNDSEKREAIIEKFKGSVFNYDKLKLSYWKALFNGFKASF